MHIWLLEQCAYVVDRIDNLWKTNLNVVKCNDFYEYDTMTPTLVQGKICIVDKSPHMWPNAISHIQVNAR